MLLINYVFFVTVLIIIRKIYFFHVSVCCSQVCRGTVAEETACACHDFAFFSSSCPMFCTSNASGRQFYAMMEVIFWFPFNISFQNSLSYSTESLDDVSSTLDYEPDPDLTIAPEPESWSASVDKKVIFLFKFCLPVRHLGFHLLLAFETSMLMFLCHYYTLQVVTAWKSCEILSLLSVPWKVMEWRKNHGSGGKVWNSEQTASTLKVNKNVCSVMLYHRCFSSITFSYATVW